MTPCYKKQVLLVWLLLLPYLCFLQGEDLSLLLERQMPKWQKQFRVPGASIALIEEAQLVWAEGFGKADAGKPGRVRPSSIFNAGPIATTVTAWGIMKLVEQGRLDLDAPVERYLERWQLPPSRFDHSKVTIRRLLSHSGGFPASDFPVRHEPDAVPLLKLLLSGIADDLPPVHVAYPPGTQFLYSKPGYSLLAMIIEDVTGDSFASFIEREIFLPLKMRNSYFDAGEVPSSRFASPHDHHGQPLPRQYDNQPAAEGFHTTALDLTRLVAAGLPNLQFAVRGYPVIERSTIQQMQRPYVSVTGKQGFGATHYGLGYFLDLSPGEVTVLFNGGYHSPGWYCYFFAIPETGDGLVVLTNSHNGLALTHSIAKQWARSLHIAPPLLIRNLDSSRRFLWGAMITGALLCFFILSILLKDFRRGLRRLARKQWPLRLTTLLAIGIITILAWTEGRERLLDWHPHLWHWPQVILSTLLGTIALLVVTEKKR